MYIPVYCKYFNFKKSFQNMPAQVFLVLKDMIESMSLTCRCFVVV